MKILTKSALIAIVAFTLTGSVDAGNKFKLSFGNKKHSQKQSQKHHWKQKSSQHSNNRHATKKHNTKKHYGNYYGNKHHHQYRYQIQQVWVPAITNHVFVGYRNGCKQYNDVIVKQGYYKNVRYRACACGHKANC